MYRILLGLSLWIVHAHAQHGAAGINDNDVNVLTESLYGLLSSSKSLTSASIVPVTNRYGISSSPNRLSAPDQLDLSAYGSGIISQQPQAVQGRASGQAYGVYIIQPFVAQQQQQQQHQPVVGPAARIYSSATNLFPAATPVSGPATPVPSSAAPIFSSSAPIFAPQPQYSAPQPQYSAPQPQYSAPQPQYSAPQPQYQVPQPHYAVPAPQPQYPQYFVPKPKDPPQPYLLPLYTQKMPKPKPKPKPQYGYGKRRRRRYMKPELIEIPKGYVPDFDDLDPVVSNPIPHINNLFLA
ncbi:hypothetical protein LSH36_45g00028 [Paralvinella palmiformis]|uniref:Uncharacterized protein n=1 Tax=Paralvinella palmiformis TaxID=53620 RepID=A0AAD9ND98_9ANNE|nr:hypothetical protein LSH36_45g00028 [Paralvinella palmiformis]